jgi:hypothetical protein
LNETVESDRYLESKSNIQPSTLYFLMKNES